MSTNGEIFTWHLPKNADAVRVDKPAPTRATGLYDWDSILIVTDSGRQWLKPAKYEAFLRVQELENATPEKNRTG